METNVSESNTQENTPTPPLAGSQLWQMQIIQAIEELQIAQRNLGKGENAQFIDLVAGRLLHNPEFYERLAQAIVAITRANQSKTTEEPVAPDSIPGVDLIVGQSAEITEMPTDDGGTVKMQTNGEVQVQSGFINFKDATHQFEIEVGLNEERALAVIGGHVLYSGQRHPLNVETSQGKALLNAINSSMQSLITSGAQTVEDFPTGRIAWFKMREFIYPTTLEA